MRILFLAAVMNAVALTTPAVAQSIAGEWDAAMNTPGGVRTFQIVFQVHSDTVTGTVKRAAGDEPLLGTIKGNLLQFSYSISYNGNILTLSVTATVAGDSLKGTVDFGGAGEDEFWAKRASPSRPPPQPDRWRTRSRYGVSVQSAEAVTLL